MARLMKNGYSSGTKKKAPPRFSQNTWRITGGAAISVCAAMTLFSGFIVKPGTPMPVLAVYWGVWVVLLLVAMYCVLLDLRYVRMEFLTEERDLFKETLAEESFRAALVQAQREYQQELRAEKETNNRKPPSNGVG